MTRWLWSAFAALVLAFAALGAACGGSGSGSAFQPTNVDDGGGPQGDATIIGTPPPPLTGGDGGTFDTEGGALVITPAAPTITVTLGTSPSITPLQFSATYEGSVVGVQWTLDRGELGTIGVGTGLFTPASLGGVGTITATYQGVTATTPITVKIQYVSVGDPSPPDAGLDGAGGYGGVGGSGEGAPATPGQVTSLNGTATADTSLVFLYPYNQTVFPQGILPPLLQWTLGTHGTFAAVLIHISETNYDYKGYFQAPATPFQNHPIPQAAWDAIEYSNGGEAVNVQLTLLDGSGAVWGPVSETWIIAPGSLKGTIYYNSYGTKLATNLCCSIGADGTDDGAPFGGATLAIKEGLTDPALVAGSNSECRVCHSVAAGGSMLITQQGSPGSYPYSSTYALTNNDVETTVPNNNTGARFEYPAVYPDGTLLFTHESPSALYTVDGTPVTGVTGLPTGLSAFTPAFSPDGMHIAYNFAGGTGSDATSIASIDFAKATSTFSNAQTLTTPTTGHAYWPSYLPTSTGIVYDIETVYNGRDVAGTRSQCDTPSSAQGGDGSLQPGNPCHSEGSHAEMWWVDVATKKAARLDNLNGKGYLPPHPSYDGGLGDDTTMNYEPTVNPVPSGGYAWVVFTSRRLYGNVATINPYWSDPRFENIASTPTPKKLWVAAIDLNATPGADPSHPAFYLPAQELLAGNSRGFWVVDPCEPNGSSCQTGDECCGGYCRPGDDGGLMCTATQPSCSQEYEKCTTTADCCGASTGIQCIGGLCAQSSPK